MRTRTTEPRPSAPDEPLLTPAHVADLLHVEPRTVRAWLQRGALVGVRLPGGDWRVLHADFDAFLQQRRHTPESAPRDVP